MRAICPAWYFRARCRRGVPPWEVAGLLGHRVPGVRTTERYAHYDPSYLGQAEAAIDAWMDEIETVLQREIAPPACDLRVSRPDLGQRKES